MKVLKHNGYIYIIIYIYSLLLVHKFLYRQYIYIIYNVIYIYINFPHITLLLLLSDVFPFARLYGYRRLAWMYGYLGILGTWSGHSWLEQWKRLHGQVRYMVLRGDSLSLVLNCWSLGGKRLARFFRGVGMTSVTSVLDLLQVWLENVFEFVNAFAFGNYHGLVDRSRLGGCTSSLVLSNKFRSTFPSPPKKSRKLLFQVIHWNFHPSQPVREGGFCRAANWTSSLPSWCWTLWWLYWRGVMPGQQGTPAWSLLAFWMVTKDWIRWFVHFWLVVRWCKMEVWIALEFHYWGGTTLICCCLQRVPWCQME